MKASLNWLKDYIDIPSPIKEIAEKLTMLGLEVEEVRDLGETYKNFLVGLVIEVRKHPSADKLVLCRVDVGSEVLEIVCGAPNVSSGQKVAVALPGALVPHDQHDPEGRPFTVKLVKIRGESSQGMICSAYELGLGEDRDGIMVLNVNAQAGISLARYLRLDDTVLEVGITPNRPDALCHVGIAREIGAIFSKPVRLPPIGIREEKQKTSRTASVQIDDRENCPRYTARIVTGVKVGDSPDWVRDRLQAVGIRSVNNVVDITNYVLMEIGQPLHAFDYDKISGTKVLTRAARKGESLTTLDGKARILRGTELLICDESGPIALAGVMGGASTEITSATRTIFIESAHFNPGSIRSTSKAHGLVTEASQRFERGADPNITRWAVDRAASMIQQECGGKVLKGTLDEYPKKVSPRKIKLRVGKLNEVLGTTLDAREVSSLLRRLCISPSPSKGGKAGARYRTFEIPTRRPDLEREIDLVEEVARIYGYDRIETNNRTVLRYSEIPPNEDFGDMLRQWLAGSGYNEVVTNSMQEKAIAALSSDEFVEIANPVSKEMGAMRTSLTTSLLAVLRMNIFHGTSDIRMFELGKVYFHNRHAQESAGIASYREEDRLILGLTGAASPRSWDTKIRQNDMSDLRGEVEALFKKIFLDKFKFIPYSNTKALTDIGLSIEINGQEAGNLGRIRSDLLKRFEIEQNVYIAELALDPLVSHRTRKRTFRELPKYPSVMRDLALTMDEGIPIERVEQEIRAAGTELLIKADLFDIYTGEQVGPGKKSCAFALEFMSKEHTLRQQEVDQIMENMIDRLSSRLQATLRA